MNPDFIDKTVSDFLADCLAALTQDNTPWSRVRVNVQELLSQLTAEAPDHPALARLRAFIALHDENQPRTRARPRPKSTAIDRHVGGRVRTRRLETDMTQRELAQATGISHARLRTIEAGTTRADAADLYALTMALKLQPSYFFEGFSPLGSE